MILIWELRFATKSLEGGVFLHLGMLLFMSYSATSRLMLDMRYILFWSNSTFFTCFLSLVSVWEYIVFSLQKSWCHKISGVKVVHSDVHKRTFPQVQLRGGSVCEGVVFHLTPKAIRHRGVWQSSSSYSLGDVSRLNGSSRPWEFKYTTGLFLQMLGWNNKY